MYLILIFHIWYLFYVGSQRGIDNSPLQNTLRFSLTFDFASMKKEDSDNVE